MTPPYKRHPGSIARKEEALRRSRRNPPERTSWDPIGWDRIHFQPKTMRKKGRRKEDRPNP